MRILDIVRESGDPYPWELGDNIPWNEPEFSKRMLQEHLSQTHDLASRRLEAVDRQTSWIHGELLKTFPGKILDLCCGPGLYGQRLAAMGHTYHGIDYSPASIAYAEEHNAAPDRCTYLQGDVRRADYGEGYGLVMMIYGEFNVFPRDTVKGILHRIRTALDDRGLLLLEPHTYAGVKAIGIAGQTWEAHETSLFSTKPHLYLRRSSWNEENQAATMQHITIDAETAETSRMAASYQAYTDAEYDALLFECGFEMRGRGAALAGDAFDVSSGLTPLLAQKRRV